MAAAARSVCAAAPLIPIIADAGECITTDQQFWMRLKFFQCFAMVFIPNWVWENCFCLASSHHYCNEQENLIVE